MKVPYSQNFKLLCSVFWGLKITEHTNTAHCCVRYFRADHFLKNPFLRTSIFSENTYNLPYVRYFFFHFLNFSKKYRTYGTISFSESEKIAKFDKNMPYFRGVRTSGSQLSGATHLHGLESTVYVTD